MEKLKITQEEIYLLRLIYKYSINRQLADAKFIKDVVKICLQDTHLNKEVETIKIKTASHVLKNGILNIARYDYLSKTLTIYLKDLNKYFTLLNKTTPFLTAEEKVFYKNLEATQIILHEIEHAKQSKKIQEGNKDLETTLLKVSFDHTDELNSMNFEEYIYDPAERLAELNSKAKAKNIASLLKLPEVKRNESLSLLDELLSGYERKGLKIKSPTLHFLNRFGGLQVLHSFDFYDKSYPRLIENINNKYPKEERFHLGLPISLKEYKKVDNKILQHVNKQKNRFQ